MQAALCPTGNLQVWYLPGPELLPHKRLVARRKDRHNRPVVDNLAVDMLPVADSLLAVDNLEVDTLPGADMRLAEASVRLVGKLLEAFHLDNLLVEGMRPGAALVDNLEVDTLLVADMRPVAALVVEVGLVVGLEAVLVPLLQADLPVAVVVVALAIDRLLAVLLRLGDFGRCYRHLPDLRQAFLECLRYFLVDPLDKFKKCFFINVRILAKVLLYIKPIYS